MTGMYACSYTRVTNWRQLQAVVVALLHMCHGCKVALKKTSKVQNLAFLFFGEMLCKSYLISCFSHDL